MNPIKTVLAAWHRLEWGHPVQPLRDTHAGLQSWCRSPMGQELLVHEQRLLEEELSCLFGYHFLQLSIDPQQHFFEGSRISHCFAMGASETCKDQVQALSEPDALPLPEASVDVTLLHHVLEFSENPQQVLKEAARVTIPRGYLIVFGFNPVSPMGAARPLARLVGMGGIWRRHSLRRSRLEDWLQFLDFNVVQRYQGHLNLPINQKTYLRRTRRLNAWSSGSAWGAGNFYCLVARKDVCGLTPIKPRWEAEPVAVPGVVSLPKQSIARTGKVARLGILAGKKPKRDSRKTEKSPVSSLLHPKE